MMLTIGGFSLATKYQDIKLLIKQECKLNDFILDNLAVGPDGAKKVSVGVTDDRDGVVLMKRLNGFRLGGGVLRVEPVGKAQAMNQSQNYDQRGFQRDNQGQGYNRPTDQRFEPWDQSNHGNHGNQWSSNQQRQDFNYQQPGMTQEYRQPQQQAQRPGEQQRPGMRPVDQQRPSLRPIEPHRSDMRPMEQQRPGMRPDEQPRPGMRPDQQRPGMRPIEQDGPAMRPIEQRPAMRPMDQQNFTQGRGSNQFQQSGFPPKANNDMQRSDRTITLRSVELMDEPLDRSTGQQGGRYQQYDQQKPITIMKDNFQGPQYNMERQANFQGQAQGRPGQTAWNQAKPNPSYDRPYPDDKRVTKPMAHDSRFKPYDKDQPRFSPRDKEHVPRFSPRRDIPKDQHVPRFSPRRDVPKDPHVPRFSPRRDVPKDHVPRFSPRRDVPKEHNAPRFSPRRETGPRFSPRRDGKGPRFSPRRDGKEPRFSPRRDVPKDMHGTPRFSPRRDVRRESPVRRILSPGRRVSPADRRAVGRKRSPEDRARRDSPNRHVPRFSPNRRADKSSDKYPDASRAKDVRPAYEPPSQAPNQAMYSGGYRPTVHQNVQYPVPGRHPETLSPWHKEQGFPKDDDRRDVSRSKFVEAKRSPRKSRSPVRRERSPVRDRYKKSASPRSSMSPHRSWILEKRRSPEIRDAPPPPMWPGHKPDEQFRGRPHDRMEDDKGKRMPVWEGRAYDDKNDRRPEDDRRPNSSVRVRSDLQRQAQPNVPRREPSPRFKPEDRPKFEPRESRFDRPHETPRFEPREDPERRPDFRREDRPYRASPEDDRRPRRDDYRRDDRKDIPVESEKFIKIDKEFEDIYKRAVEFNKKAQELRKREDYTDDRPGSKEYRKYDDRRDVRDERDYRDDRRHDERPTGSVPSKWDDWKPQDRDRMSPTIRAKRDKAVEELAQRIVDKHGTGFNAELKKRVFEEMKISLAKILKGIYGNQDVSFIEIVVKFNAKFNAMDEKKIFDDVMSSLPSHYRNMKRPVEEPVPAAVVPAKVARVAAPAVMPDPTPIHPAQLADWNMQMQASMQYDMMGMPQPFDMMSQMQMPQMQMPQMMMPAPVMAPELMPFNNQSKFDQPFAQPVEEPKPPQEEQCFNLYLCKDNFEPYSIIQAELLKKFLVSQIVRLSQEGSQWTPDFTIKGLQSLFRYEVEARDISTRNWIINLDFSSFSLFNILVYTKEELWYERAAIWLPGHSKFRSKEPLEKLELQNKDLDGVNIGKWKLVKKILTVKGTRVYVDMPPSSARALEQHKMMLSYELQKVNVFLKVVAIDKDAFDSALKEQSIDHTEILAAIQNSPMPSLGSKETSIVKIGLKGNKTVTVEQARRIKEMIIYKIYRHHIDYNLGRTDFVKFGYCQPGYLGVVPENDESKRWLTSLEIGKLNRHPVVIIGADQVANKYIKMYVYVNERCTNAQVVQKRLKQSNQGVKGINFNSWKPFRVVEQNRHNRAEFDMDLESVETIMKMNFKLDYIDERRRLGVAEISYEGKISELENLIKKYKAEQSDSYDVANMDLASSEDEDLVFMGEYRK